MKTALHRLALGLGIFGLVLLIPAALYQAHSIPGGSLVPLYVGLSILSALSWCVALCALSKARGYHPLWGLLLLFPPMILLYPVFFPQRDRSLDRR
jgi:hypothetical protein